MINTKADIKRFLRSKGITTIALNKRAVMLDQAQAVELRKVAIANGYGK